MDNQRASDFYREILALLEDAVPWVAAEVDQTISQGKPTAKQIRRDKMGSESVFEVRLPAKLGEGQFSATTEFTPIERVKIALDAVERILLDPPQIDDAVRSTLNRTGVSDALFADPEDAQSVAPAKPTIPGDATLRELETLLAAARRDLSSVS